MLGCRKIKLMYSDQWQKNSYGLRLSSHEIHIWCADLKRALAEQAILYDLLSIDERKRVSEYKFEKDAQYYTCARGILRTILGRYLTMEPQNIHFLYNDYGKPYLVTEKKSNFVQFNLSHSGDLALYVFSKDYEVGIDLEKVKSFDNLLDIAQQFFSVQEIANLNTVQAERRLESFYKCWTRKESVIKAIGCGLSFPLDQFTVSFAHNEPARIVDLQLASSINKVWSLYSVDTIPGYQGAVTVIGPEVDFNFKQFTY